MTQTTCKAPSFKGRILYPWNRKLDRNYCIWDLWLRGARDQKDVAELIGCSQSLVSNVICNLSVLKTTGAVLEYFKIGFDLSDIIEKKGRNPDQYVFGILRSIYNRGFRSRDDLISATDEEIQDIIKTQRMKSIGVFAQMVIDEYVQQLKSQSK